MLHITEDKTREWDEGQFFVELTSNRGLDIVNCDRLGYWCDKPHLEHMLKGIGKAFTQDELKDLLNIKGEQYQPKAGDLVIAWDGNPRDAAICTLLHVDSKGLSTTKVGVRHCCFENIVKFESMDQYEKIRRGEI